LLGDNRNDPVGNYYRRVAITELRSLPDSAPVEQAINLLIPGDAGQSTCEYEDAEPPVDEADPAKKGARRVSFGLRVKRNLNATLQAILDPQSWDDYSAFMVMADAVVAQEVNNYPLDADIPETAAPPAKGSEWSTISPPPPPPPRLKLYEHFVIPQSFGSCQFRQTFDINVTVDQAAQKYGFTYRLDTCRWSVILGLAGPGGISRNQGRLVAEQQGAWTHVVVDKSLLVDERPPYPSDMLTRWSAALLKAGWRGELRKAVTDCPNAQQSQQGSTQDAEEPRTAESFSPGVRAATAKQPGVWDQLLELEEACVQDYADTTKALVGLAMKRRMLPSLWARPVIELLRRSAKRADEVLKLFDRFY
jgi:hypothetical protein